MLIAPNGSVDGITFDMEKTSTTLLTVDGDFNLNLYGFVNINEHISFSLTFETLTLSTEESASVAYLTFSKSDINYFAGFNEGQDNEMGFSVENASFGLGVFMDVTNPTNVWVAGKSELNYISFSGMENLSATSSNATLEFNMASINGNGTTIDFDAKNFTLSEGIGAGVAGASIGEGEGIIFDMSGEMFAVTGDFELEIYNVIFIEGEFGFEKAVKTVKLYNDGVETETTVDSLLIAANDITAFAGYQYTDDDGVEYKIGFGIGNLDFAFAMMFDRTNTERYWISLQSSADTIGLVGVNGLTAQAYDITFTLNTEAIDNSIIDYESTGGVSIGDTDMSITLGKDLGSHIAIDGAFEFNAFDIVQTKEQMSFFFNIETVKLNSGETEQVIVLSLALTDMRVFAGVGDDTDNPVGLEINDLNLGLALSHSITTHRTWVGMQAKANDVSLLGMESMLSLDAESVSISMNVPDFLDGTVIDYSQTPLSLDSLNGGTPFVMDMSGASGANATLSIENATLSILDFVHANGSFAFSVGGGISLDVESGDLLSTITSGIMPSIESDSRKFVYMTFGGSDLDLYFGLNGPYYGSGDEDDSVGYFVQGIDFGIGIFVEDVVSTYIDSLSFDDVSNLATDAISGDIDVEAIAGGLSIPMIGIASKTHIGEVGSVGFSDFIDSTLKDISLEVNFGIQIEDDSSVKLPWINFESSFPSVDGSETGFELQTGDTPVYLDFSTATLAASVGNAEFQIDEYLYLRGNVGITFEAQLVVDVGMGALEQFFTSLSENTLIDMNSVFGDSFDLAGLDLSLDSISLSMFSLGFAGSDLYGFVGLGGPYYSDTNGDGLIDENDEINESALGIMINDVDFGMMVSMPSSITELEKIGLGGRVFPVFVTAQANVGSASFAGTMSETLFEIKVEDIRVDINSFFVVIIIEEPQTLAIVNAAVNAALVVLGPPYINWASSFSDYSEDRDGDGILDEGEDLNGNGTLDDGEDLDGDGVLDLREDVNGNGIIDNAGYVLKTGSDSGIFFGYDSETVSTSVGYTELDIGGMLQTSGSMSMIKKGAEEVILSNGDTAYVSSMALSFNDLNAYVGLDGYFRDTNLNGRFDEEDENNSDATGFLLEDMDLAMTLMLEVGVAIDSISLGVYSAGLASVGTLGMIGFDDIDFEANNVEFNYNAGVRAYLGVDQINSVITGDILSNLPLTATSVDFSQSTWTDTDGVEQEGYAITVGNTETPVVLDYDSTKLGLSGEIDIDLHGAMVFSGVVDIEIGLDGIVLFGDVFISVGTDDDLPISTDATVFLVLKDAVAGRVTFSNEFSIGSIGNVAASSFGGNFILDVNASGEDVTYSVDEKYHEILGYEELTISASPIEGDDAVDFYVKAEVDGYLNLFDAIKLDGEMELIYSADGFVNGGDTFKLETTMSIAGNIDTPMFEEQSITGTLGLYNAGIYGSLEIGNPFSEEENVIIKTDSLALSGAMMLQFNTTSIAQTVRSLVLDDDGNVTGEYETSVLDTESLFMQGNGKIETSSIDGSASMGTYLSGTLVVSNIETTVMLSSGDGSDTTSTADVTGTVIAAKDIDIFSGFNKDTDKEMGFEASNIDFAFLSLEDINDDTRNWSSLQFTADSMGLVGIDWITAIATDASFDINYESHDDYVIDYHSMGGVSVKGIDLDIDIEGSRGNHIGIGGDFEFSMFDDLFSFEYADVDMSQTLDSVVLANGQTEGVSIISTALTDINIFVGFGKDTDYATGFNISDLDIGLALVYSPISQSIWTSFQADAQNVGIVGFDSILELEASSVSLTYNSSDYLGRSIDYSQRSIEIESLNGGSTFVMDMDSTNSTSLVLSFTDVKISLMSFVYIEGSLSVSAGMGIELDVEANYDLVSDVTDDLISTTSGKMVFDYFTFGLDDASMYVGLNTPYYGEGDTGDSLGVYASDVDASFAVFNQNLISTAFVNPGAALGLPMMNVVADFNMGTAGMVGLEGFMDISISDVDLKLNYGYKSGVENWINFASSLPATSTSEAGFAIPTGDETVYIDFSESFMEASIGSAEIYLADFIYLSGSLAMSYRGSQSFTLNDDSTVNAQSLILTVSDASGFAGLGRDTDYELGFGVDDVNLQLGLFSDIDNAFNVWTASVANIGSVEYKGLDGIEVSAQSLYFKQNVKSLTGTAIDFSDNPIELIEGSGLSFDMAQEELGMSGTLEFRMFDLISMSGEFAIESAVKDITITDGEDSQSVEVNQLAIGANDISAFVGFNIDDLDNRVGFELVDLDMALVMMSDRSDNKREWTTLYANAASSGLVGGADGLEIGSKETYFHLNKSSYDSYVVDYKAMGGLAITGTTLEIDIDGADGAYTAIGSTFTMDVFGLVQLEKEFTFKIDFETVKLSDGTGDNVIVMGAAITDVDMFAGVGKETDYAVGLEINDIDIGFALVYSPFTQAVWYTLEGSASDIDLVGLDSLVDVSATNVTIAINTADIYNRTIDYTQSDISVTSLTSDTPFTFSVSGNESGSITITEAEFSLLNMVHISGNMALTMGNNVELYAQSDGSLLGIQSGIRIFDYLSFAGSDINMFVGLGDPYYGDDISNGAIGLYAGGLDFAFTIFVQDMIETAKTDPLQLLNAPMINISTKLDIAEAGMVGVDSFMDFTIKNVSLNINSGLSGISRPWIDFTQTAGFDISTGGDPITLDFDSAFLEAYIGSVEIQVADFLYLRGAFSMTYEQAVDVQVTSAGLQSMIDSLVNNDLFELPDDLGGMIGENGTITSSLSMLTFSGLDMYGFVGVGGPYLSDTNGDGLINNQDTVNDGAIGVAISDVDFAMTISTASDMLSNLILSAGITIQPIYFTAKASVGEASMKMGAASNIFTLKAEDLSIDLNTSYSVVNLYGIPLSGDVAMTLGTAIIVSANAGGITASVASFGIAAPAVVAALNVGGTILGAQILAVGTAVSTMPVTLGVPYIDWATSFPDFTEDTNGNGVLDLTEDSNGNGVLDDDEDTNSDGVLDLAEDVNGNGVIDTTGYAITSANNSGLIYDFSTEVISATIGYAELDIAGLVQISGGMTLAKKGGEEVLLDNGDNIFVQSLDIAMENVSGFVGFGGYFQDTNNNGRFDDADTRNDEAVGFVIDDIDLAMSMMYEFSLGLDSASIGAYSAIYASAGTMGVVGIPNTSLVAEDIEFGFSSGVRGFIGLDQLPEFEDGSIIITEDMLTHLPLGIHAVDFSSSTWTNTLGEEFSGYAIVVGDKDNPIVLDYTGNTLGLKGELDFNMYDAVRLQGVADISMDENGISLFGDMIASIGTADTVEISSTAQVLLLIKDGIAGKFELSQTIDLGLSSVEGDFVVELNTTGDEVVYDVDEDLVDNLGYEQLIIASTPYEDSTEAVDFYLSMEGSGSLNILNTIELDGEVGFIFSVDGLANAGDSFELQTEMTVASFLDLGFIDPLAVAGSLGFYNGDLYGALQVGTPIVEGTQSTPTYIVNNAALSIGGHFLFQINTTSKTQQIKTFELDEYGEATGEFVFEDVEANSLLLGGQLLVDVIGGVSMMGIASLNINSNGLTGSSTLYLDLASIGSMVVESEIAILDTDTEGFVFALRGETHLDFSVGIAGVSADAVLEINTSDTTSYAGVDAGTLFNLELDGDMNLFAFNMGFDGGVSIVDDVLELRIDSANLNFFNVVTVDISGWAKSDGTFYFNGSSSLNIGFNYDVLGVTLSAGVQGSLSVVLSNDLLSGSISGKIYGGVKVAGEWIGAEAYARGSISLTPYSASVNLSAGLDLGVLGEATVSKGFSWSIGSAPNIATKSGDTLYLNMGDRSKGSAYDNTINEVYDIWQDGDTVYVSALNETRSYTGITNIIADGGSGNDTFNIDSSVTKTLELKGGDGNDTFNLDGGALGTVIYGDAGDDKITSHVEGLYYYGGTGDDTFVGTDGVDYIYMGTGKNDITARGGDDIIESEAGTINAGAGDDKIYSSMGEKLTVIAGDGYDELELVGLNIDDTLYIGGNSTLQYKNRELVFDTSLDNILLVDGDGDISLEKFNTTSDEVDWVTTSITIETGGIVELNEGTKFNISEGTMKIVAERVIGDLDIKVQNLDLTVKYAEIANDFDADGNDIGFVSEDVTISAPIKSDGGSISFVAEDPTSDIVIGNLSGGANGAMQLDLTEIGFLEDGFAAIVIGSDESSGTIQIGDSSNDSGEVIFSDTLVIKNPGDGGEILIDDALTLQDSASFVVFGSGQTTLLSNDVTLDGAGAFELSDSLKIVGTVGNNNLVTISAEDGNIEIGADEIHSINGDSDLSNIADNLVLTTQTGDVIIVSSVGTVDALESMVVTGSNISFAQEVIVNGDLTLNANGDVSFADTVTINGDLYINNAEDISFASTVNVTGKIYLEGLEIDLSDTVTADTLEIASANSIYIGDGFTDNETTLLLTNTEFNYIYSTVNNLELDTSDSFTAVIANGDFTISEDITSVNDISITTQNGSLVLNGDLTSTAGDVTLSSNGDITQNANIELNGTDKTLSVISSTGSISMADNISSINENGIVTYSSQTAMNLETITANSFVASATIGDIILSGSATTTDDLTITANDGSLVLDGALTSTTGDVMLSSNSYITQNADITALGENTIIDIVAQGGDITMSSDAITTSTEGDILYHSLDDLNISIIKAENGNVELKSTAGIITDVHNDNNTNVYANGINIIGEGITANGYNLYDSNVISAQLEAIETSASSIFTSIPNSGITQVDYTKFEPYMGILGYGGDDWFMQFINDTEAEGLQTQIELNSTEQGVLLNDVMNWQAIVQLNTIWMDHARESLENKTGENSEIINTIEDDILNNIFDTDNTTSNNLFETSTYDLFENNNSSNIFTIEIMPQNNIGISIVPTLDTSFVSNNLLFEPEEDELYEYWMEELYI